MKTENTSSRSNTIANLVIGLMTIALIVWVASSSSATNQHGKVGQIKEAGAIRKSTVPPIEDTAYLVLPDWDTLG
jgi:hypothetical protein